MTCTCGHAEAAHRHHRRHAAYCGHEGCTCNRQENRVTRFLRTYIPLVTLNNQALRAWIEGHPMRYETYMARRDRILAGRPSRHAKTGGTR